MAGGKCLRSIWEPHILRDFELRVILQMSGCEGVLARLLAGESLGAGDRAPLDLANYIAKQKGFLPLFLFSGRAVRISENGCEILLAFLGSQVWTGRNAKQTRRA